MQEEYDGVLENWSTYLARMVIGRLVRDRKKRFIDNTVIHTSSLQEDIDMSSLKEGDIIRTRNSIYLLGKQLW